VGLDRVPIDRLLRKHTENPEVTGGYIFKIDRLDPGDNGFTGGGQRLAFVEPKEDEIESNQRKYVVSFLNAMNRTFRDRDFEKPVSDYEQYIDEGSWIDFHIVNEFTKNPDGFRLSTYMHLPRNGRLTFGPVWDFDRTLGPDDDGRAANPVGWSTVRHFGWWGTIFRNPNFDQAYLDRWQEIRRNVMSVQNMHDIIDTMAAELEESQARNFQKWPLLRNTAAWRSEVRHLKNWVKDRAEWIDEQYVDAPDFVTNQECWLRMV
jgi:spore coat protein CotH